MKKVESKYLQVGKLYKCRNEIKFPVIKFLGFDEENDPYFEHYSGQKCYLENEKGHIEMFKNESFYEYETEY